jgi:hypothetical protein
MQSVRVCRFSNEGVKLQLSVSILRKPLKNRDTKSSTTTKKLKCKRGVFFKGSAPGLKFGRLTDKVAFREF